MWTALRPCLFVLLCTQLAGQTPRFEPALTAEQRISGTVTRLCQDRTGFLWIGSTDGLYRYDGVELRPFFNDRSRPASLSGNRIYDLHEDATGRMLIGTDRGLSVYDPITERFTNHQTGKGKGYDANARVLSVTEDPQGRIWYGTYNGFFQLDVVTGNSQRLEFMPDSL
ncbi:MAG: two-component regulator propeller domain-containing protein, partial [Bacteroidota bacterium]